MQIIDIHAETDIQYESGCAWCLLLAQTLQLSSTKKTEQGFHLRTLKMGILSLEVILIRLIYTYIIFASPSVFLSLFLSPPLQKKKPQVDVIIYSLWLYLKQQKS